MVRQMFMKGKSIQIPSGPSFVLQPDENIEDNPSFLVLVPANPMNICYHNEAVR